MTTMISEEQLETLEQVAEDHDLTVREDYSGRGMYGSQCIGVVGDSVGQVIKFLVELSKEDEELGEEFVDASISSDSMGLSGIWYWPGIRLDREVAD